MPVPAVAGAVVEDCSVTGRRAELDPLSSNIMAILNEPSTMATTLAPTSSERIFDVIAEPLAAARMDSFSETARLGASVVGALAAARAARRAAAMKLDVLAGSTGAADDNSLMASSDAAMRSDGDIARPGGRVPGSSG